MVEGGNLAPLNSVPPWSIVLQLLLLRLYTAVQDILHTQYHKMDLISLYSGPNSVPIQAGLDFGVSHLLPASFPRFRAGVARLGF